MRTGRRSELAVSLVPRQRTAAVGGFAVLTPGKRKTGELLAPAGQLSTGAEKVNHLCSFHIERLMHWCARRGEGCLCEE